MEYFSHQLNYMKVALAIAIIRKKPKNCESIKDFTQKLSIHFSDLQNDWKSQVLSLRQELLFTKQNDIIEQIQDTNDNQIGLDLYYDDDSSKQLPFDHFLPPPISISDEISTHVIFIQAISKLQSLRLVELVQNDQTLNTIKGTVIRCCNMLSNCMKSKSLHRIPVNEQLFVTTIRHILQLYQLECVDDIKHDLMEANIELLESSLHRLCYCYPDNEVDVSTLKSVIHHYSSIDVLCKISMTSLAEQIERCITIFIDSTQDPLNLDLKMINSLGTVLKLFQCLVASYDHPIPIEVVEILDKSLDRLINISTSYPIVCFGIWKLHGIIKTKYNTQ